VAETLLADVVARIGPPKDARSFGPVMRDLHRAGIVSPSGYAPAKTSHGSAKIRWMPM
jgi:hypothetical protein